MTNEINQNISKGVELLNEALKRYGEGDNNAAFKAYEAAGKFLKEAKERSNTNEGKISMVYGGNRNFGMIYKIFESNTRELLKDKNKTKQLNKIMNLIKENKVLRNEFAAYNAFTNPTNVENAQEYVNEAVSLIKHYSKKTLKENNEKLISLFKECKLNENISVSDEEIELYEGIEYMILNKKSFNNINEYAKIQEKLCEYVNENNNVITESKTVDELYNEKINEMVNKHETVLTEDEIKLIQTVTSNPTKARRVFESTKNDVVTLLREEIEKDVDSDSWATILEGIQNKEYSQENALKDIAEFIELRNELEH